MRPGVWDRLAFGRVNALVPLLAAAAGVAWLAAGHGWEGAGIVVGAVFAFVNTIVLSRRVEFAADQGDVGRALIVAQGGLFITFIVVGIVTFILIKLALALAVSAAVSFAVTQLAIVVLFFLTHRSQMTAGGHSS